MQTAIIYTVTLSAILGIAIGDGAINATVAAIGCIPTAAMLAVLVRRGGGKRS